MTNAPPRLHVPDTLEKESAQPDWEATILGFLGGIDPFDREESVLTDDEIALARACDVLPPAV